jgi:hypothetical protein
MATELVVDLDPARMPAGATAARPQAVDTSEDNHIVGASIDQVRQEVDDAFAQMATFYQLDPDEIMRLVGGHSARLSYLRVRIMRIEDYQRTRLWKDVRVREVEPCLEELEKQWRNASRLHSVRELDWKIESGER